MHTEAMVQAETSNQLEVFLRHSPGAIAMLDRDFNYLLVNENWNKHFNVAGEHLVGNNHPEHWSKITGGLDWTLAYGKALSGETSRSDQEVIRVGAEEIFIEREIFPWKDDEGKIGGIMIFCRIISEEIKAKMQLRSSQQQFKNIYDKSMLGIALVQDGGVPFMVNKKFEEIVGYPEKDIQKMTFSEFTHPDDVDKDVSRYKKLLAGEIDGYTIMKRYVRKNGDLRHVRLNVTQVEDELNKKSFSLALVEDVTDLKESELKADKLSKTLNDLSELARIGMWELDLESKKVQWSSVVYQIHELEEGTPIKLEDGLRYYHPESREAITLAVNECMDTGMPWDLELRIISEKGNEKWVRAVGTAVISNGKVTSLQGLFQDIDEQKRAEISIQESEKHLIREVNQQTKSLKQANEELESFSYSVSHDLRAPLRAINGYAEALLEDYDDQLEGDAQKYLRRIAMNSTKMGVLIDDLLEFSRMNRKTSSFVKIDLNELFADLISDLFKESESVIKLDKLHAVQGDREMLTQVFTNLLSNALKYSSKEKTQRIEVTSEDIQSHVVISVSDNGVGFNTDYSDKLFKVFQRLHSDVEFEGTGVGLALCKKIVTMHEGEIWAESELGEGSRFNVKLRK